MEEEFRESKQKKDKEKVIRKREELKVLDVNRTTLKIWYSKQKYYEFEGKGGKILANKIRNFGVRKNIRASSDDKRELETEPKKILEIFLKKL